MRCVVDDGERRALDDDVAVRGVPGALVLSASRTPRKHPPTLPRVEPRRAVLGEDVGAALERSVRRAGVGDLRRASDVPLRAPDGVVAGVARREFRRRVSHEEQRCMMSSFSSGDVRRKNMPSKKSNAVLNTPRSHHRANRSATQQLHEGQRPSALSSSITREGTAPRLTKLLIFVIMLGSMISFSRGEEAHVIRRFEHSPGLHFEPLGNLKLSNRMWTIAFTMGMSPLIDRVDQVTDELDKAESLCARTKEAWGTYGMLIGRWRSDFNIQRSYLQDLLSSGSARRRRGLVNGLGSIAKSLFGTMDAEDAKHIYGELSRLEGGQQAAFKAANRQIQIVNSTIAHLRRAEAEVNANERALSKSINDAYRYVDGKYEQVSVRVALEEHMVAVEAVMNGVIRDIERIKTLTKGKLLDSEVVPEGELVAILRNTSYPTGFSLPFNPKVNGLQIIEEVSSLAVQIFKGKIVTVLKVPLVTSETFNVYAVHGIPQRSTDGVFTYLRPSNDLLVVQGATRYVKMTMRQLDECKVLGGQYLCTQQLPIHTVTQQSPCEVQLYSHPGKLPETCVPEHIALTHLTLIQLHSGTAWLYVAPTPEEIMVRCDATTKRETLRDAGILQLRDFCEVETADFSIFGRQVSGTQLDLHVHPKLNITFPEESRRIIEKLVSRNSSKVSNGQVIRHIDELRDLQFKLDLEKEQLDKEDREWHYPPFFTQPVTLGVGAVILIIFVSCCAGICFWIRYCRKPGDKPQEETNWRTRFEERHPEGSGLPRIIP